TDKGASVIVEEISSEFISTVNGIIFDMFNQIGLELEEDVPDIEQFKDYIFTMEESLPEIHDVLTSTDEDATEAKDIIEKVLGKIPETKKQTNEELATINTTLTYVEDAEAAFNDISPKVTKDLKQAQGIVHEVNKALEKAKEQGSISNKIDEKLEKTQGDIQSSLAKLGEVNTLLTKVQEQIENDNVQKNKNENNATNEETEENQEPSQEQGQTKLSTEDIEKAKQEVNNLI